MTNNNNLKKGNPATQFKAGRKQVKIATQGGIESGKARRKTKSYKEIFEILQSSPIKKNKTIKVHEELPDGSINYVEKKLIDYLKEKYPNLTELEINNAVFASIKMIELVEHPDAKVAIKAFEVIRDTSGQKPVDKVEKKETKEFSGNIEYLD